MSSTRATASKTWAVALLALALVWAASFTRVWHALEFKSFDLLATVTAPGPSPLPIVVLAIDEPTFQQLGQAWPFPRSIHAQLLERLRADGAAAVGFDVLFSEASREEEDAAFAEAIARFTRQAAPVVLASARERADNANADLWVQVLPLARFAQAGAIAGESMVQPDDDFVVRRAHHHAGSFAARMAALAGGGAPDGTQEYIVYRGPRGTFDTRSYYQALLPGLLPPGFFKGKTVLVGRSALSAVELSHAQADLFNSPFAALGGERLFPGVELQATLIDNQLTGAGLRGVSEGWSLALVGAACALLLAAGRRLHPGAAAALAAALAAGVALLSWALFARGLWLAPLFPMAAVLAVYGAMALAAYAATRRHARLTRAMFAQYVPPTVVERLVAQPHLLRLGGEAREVTLMFTDLEGFTTLSELLSAEQTVELLTLYFNTMTPLIHATGGTVDKFIGDAVMAFWGAPLDDAHHAEHAVRAALAMRQAMEGLAGRLRERGLPPVHMRIGLHTGRVVVGNVGSEQRFSYTAIGDAVNLAARLEGANKAFGTHILMSGSTAERLPPELGLRALDDVIVKGRSEPVRVFTPCDDARVRALSRDALQHFHARQWAEAGASLDALCALLPGDPAATRLAERLEQVRRLPATDAWQPAVALDKL